MNPSYECMRVAREESRAELLEMRRWDVSRRLNALELGEGSHENLSAIASVIYEPKFGWTREACDYLRNQLMELIGGERDAQRGCAGGTGGCDCRHEQTPFVGYDVLGNERHKAVCELRKMDGYSLLAHNFRDALAAAIGVSRDTAPYDDKELCHLICDRLIHLLGGDNQYVIEYPRVISKPDGITITNGEHKVRIVKDDIIADGVSVVDIVNDTINKALRGQSRTCPESEPCVSESDYGTSITSELREWVRIREMETITYTTMPPQTEKRPTYSGQRLLAIADRIDEKFAEYQEAVEALALVITARSPRIRNSKEKSNE